MREQVGDDAFRPVVHLALRWQYRDQQRREALFERDVALPHLFLQSYCGTGVVAWQQCCDTSVATVVSEIVALILNGY